MTEQNNGRIFAAETVGTAVLILGGPGTAILASEAVGSTVGIALGFGLSLMIMVYVIGPISGCHINPAVTLGAFLARRCSGTHAIFAVLGQLVGAIGGAAVIYGIASGRDDWERGQFAANLWTAPGKYFGLGSTIVVEVIFTALLVLVVLVATKPGFPNGLNGVVIGLTLTLIHLITIPVDNTSVNPVRSLATALFADQKTDALQQLWAFIVFPLLGAVIGVMIFLMLDDSRLEDTLLAEVPGLTDVRDTLDHGVDEAVDGIEDVIDRDD
ncbi:MAG: aquaporin [Ilumatobacteraceae bacterium]